MLFIWEETRAEKEGRLMEEEQAWENEGDRRDRPVMCEMLVRIFFWQSPTPVPVIANCPVFIIYCIPNDFPCEWDFYFAYGGAQAYPDCELQHELSSEWDERPGCLQLQKGRIVLCKTVFGLPFTCYHFCWFFYWRWIDKYKFKDC